MFSLYKSILSWVECSVMENTECVFSLFPDHREVVDGSGRLVGHEVSHLTCTRTERQSLSFVLGLA